MIEERKEALNAKLRQIYDASGRIEGVIENLLQEEFLGHTYFIHSIEKTWFHPPCCNDCSQEDKDYTIIVVGLYQEGNACISEFRVPVTTLKLHQIASRIDMAYYRWMQREPSWLKNQPGRGMRHDYYRMLLDVIPPSIKSAQDLNLLSDEEYAQLPVDVYTALFKLRFDGLPLDKQNEMIDQAEWYAFLPQGGHEQ